MSARETQHFEGDQAEDCGSETSSQYAQPPSSPQHESAASGEPTTAQPTEKVKGQVQLKSKFLEIARSQPKNRADNLSNTAQNTNPQGRYAQAPVLKFGDTMRWSVPTPHRTMPFFGALDDPFIDSEGDTDTNATDGQSSDSSFASADTSTAAQGEHTHTKETDSTDLGLASINYRNELVYRVMDLQARIVSFHAEQHRLVLHRLIPLPLPLPGKKIRYSDKISEELMSAADDLSNHVRQVRGVFVSKEGASSYKYRLDKSSEWIDLAKEEIKVTALLHKASLREQLGLQPSTTKKTWYDRRTLPDVLSKDDL